MLERAHGGLLSLSFHLSVFEGLNSGSDLCSKSHPMNLLTGLNPDPPALPSASAEITSVYHKAWFNPVPGMEPRPPCMLGKPSAS